LLNKKTLSVVVCNYNHAHYLPVALQAILDQSYLPLEVIVIDDASTDNSVEIIQEFAKQYPIVHLYHNEHNKGVLYSTNRSLELAVGEYIYWAAADDCVYPGFFKKTMNMLSQYPEAGLCSALLELIDEDGVGKGWIKSPIISNENCFLPPEEVANTFMKYGFWFTGQTVICKRDAVLNGAGSFIPELAHRTDHFVDMVAAFKYGACFIPEVLATYRILGTGFAESSFDNEDLSRDSFALTVKMMRDQKYTNIFPKGLINVFEDRGWYDLEVRSLRRLLQGKIDFLNRLKALRRKPSILDNFFFFLIKFLTLIFGFVAKAYLWHRRINWDFRWLLMKMKIHFTKPECLTFLKRK